MAEAIVMYSSPMISHLQPLVNLATFISSRRPSFTIHILLPPQLTPQTAAAVADIAARVPSLKFHRLPADVSAPNGLTPTDGGPGSFEVLRRNNPLVHQVLVEISKSHTILAFIIDFFCSCVLPISSQLNIPTYFYFTSPASCLALFTYFPTLHRSTSKNFVELGKTPLNIPGIPPLAAKDLPSPLLDRHREIYSHFLEFSESIPKFAGMLVNSSEALEGRTVEAIREGKCLAEEATPPLFCTGPLLPPYEKKNPESAPREECLKWLDLQPCNSVVFLSFGSLGTFSKEQVREIAIGLELSERRFLWVVRIPSAELNKDMKSFMPEGFFERIGERGFIVESWGPQVAILEHPAVGGFVSHCGWNSVLEAVRAGVPLVSWPLYAEQRMSRVVLVKEIKIALWMEEDDNGFVGREEVEKRTREIIGNPIGEELRRRCEDLKRAGESALSPDGSAVAELERFLTSLSDRQV